MKLCTHNFYVLITEKYLQETINFHQYVKTQLFFYCRQGQSQNQLNTIWCQMHSTLMIAAKTTIIFILQAILQLSFWKITAKKGIKVENSVSDFLRNTYMTTETLAISQKSRKLDQLN